MRKRQKHPRQLEMVLPTRGGRRKGAGRPPRGPRSSERHKQRLQHDSRHPVHVTIRVVADVSSLRRADMYRQLREATLVTARREDFRIVHLSIQSNHVHMIVEAEHKAALSRGVQGFSISAAKRVNAAISERTGVRRRGRVIADRFHARPLTTPRAVRHAISYVLNNWRRHHEDKASFARTWLVDPYSSGVVFPDWKELEGSPFLYRPPPTYVPLLVRRPRTWLLEKGWRRFHPLISVHEIPGH